MLFYKGICLFPMNFFFKCSPLAPLNELPNTLERNSRHTGWVVWCGMGGLFSVITKYSHSILWQFVCAVKYTAFYLLMWKSFASVWCYRWCSVWLTLVACRSSALRCPPGSPPCSTLWRSETPSSPFSSATRTSNLSVQEPRALCGQYLFITLLYMYEIIMYTAVLICMK